MNQIIEYYHKNIVPAKLNYTPCEVVYSECVANLVKKKEEENLIFVLFWLSIPIFFYLLIMCCICKFVKN